MQHFEHFGDVIGMRHAGADMLRGANDAGIGRVDVEIARAWQLAADIGALEEMDIVAMIDDARAIIEIDNGRFTIFAGQRLNDVHSGASGAVINIFAPRIHVIARVLRIKREAAGSFGDGVFHQRTREAHATVRAHHRADLGHVFNRGGNGVGKADLLQHIEDFVVDFLHVFWREDLVFATGHTGPDRPVLIGELGGARLAAGIASTTAARILHCRIICLGGHSGRAPLKIVGKIKTCWTPNRQEIAFHQQMNLIHIMREQSSISRPDPKPLSLPPLTALRAFEAAARHESFRSAAEELNITQSAVSHQIAHLEKWLGKDLFRRTGRKVELTDAGRLYFPYLREAFEKIDAGTQLVSRPAQQELTVQLYVTVAARWMMGRLSALQLSCPDLLVRFNASQMDWEFDPRHADVGIISTTEPNRQGFSYTPLFEARLIAVCSPKLLEQSPPIVEPGDVVRHTLLQVYTAQHDWDVWLGAAGLAVLNEGATIRFDSYLLALEAAMDGQGIAIVPDFLARQDLTSGRLVQPVLQSVPQPARWYLVSRKDRTDEPAISRFRFWLLGEVAEMQQR